MDSLKLFSPHLSSPSTQCLPLSLRFTSFPRPHPPPHHHHRRSLLKLCTSPSNSYLPRTAISDPHHASQERQKLKQQLFQSIEATHGSLDEHCMALIQSLEMLNPHPDIASVPHLYIGCFDGVRSSFKGTGRKGEAYKDVGFTGSSITLGRATFNAFKPRDVVITMKKTYNHVGLEVGDSYSIIIEFVVEDRAANGEQPMEGLLINKARFSVVSPTRMNVVFVSSTMRIRNPTEEDLERWMKLFKEANSGMDDKGSVSASLPPAKGYLDYLYIDEDLRITRGNRGGVAVVRRMAEQIVHL